MIIEQGRNYIELQISTPAPGSNARRISIGVRCGDSEGAVAESWLEPGEFEGFLDELRNLDRVRSGQATLSAEDPRGFQLTIAASDRAGHLEVKGQIAQDSREASSTLSFRFELEPSVLPRVLRNFELVDAAA
jgi:hypothetical protein